MLQPVGDITTWADTPFRWMDTADFLYSTDYRESFTYDQPLATLTFCDIANTFRGTLIVGGLKPNFAYQIKQVGKPEKEWGADGDDWTNEQLGYAGRWWRKQPNPGNSNDADYEAHKDDPDYIFLGYLLFVFFVTDEQGNAMAIFAVDSSYHVLWATHDSTGDGTGHRDPGTNDSQVRYYDFIASPATNANAYDTDYGAAHVGIYAEWEPGSALPGELDVLIPYSESDIDHDGSVDGSDLATFISAYSSGHAEADLNQDDFVNSSDVALFAEQFGNHTCQADI